MKITVYIQNNKCAILEHILLFRWLVDTIETWKCVTRITEQKHQIYLTFPTIKLNAYIKYSLNCTAVTKIHHLTILFCGGGGGGGEEILRVEGTFEYDGRHCL